MLHRLCKLALVLLFSSAALPSWADLGPKPTIALSFPASSPVSIKEGTLLLCQKSDCSDAKALERLGPQHFSCTGNQCSGMAYGFAPYLQLRILSGDGTVLTSSVFEKKAFDAHYTLHVQGKTLKAIEH